MGVTFKVLVLFCVLILHGVILGFAVMGALIVSCLMVLLGRLLFVRVMKGKGKKNSIGVDLCCYDSLLSFDLSVDDFRD